MEELQQLIDKSIQSTLANDVAPKIEANVSEHISSDVYGAYSPKKYQRRGSSGGMLSADHIRTEIKNNGQTILVQDITTGNTPWSKNASAPGAGVFSKIINDGLQGGGQSRGLWRNAFPRPYIENAQQDARDITISVLSSKYDHI